MNFFNVGDKVKVLQCARDKRLRGKIGEILIPALTLPTPPVCDNREVFYYGVRINDIDYEHCCSSTRICWLYAYEIEKQMPTNDKFEDDKMSEYMHSNILTSNQSKLFFPNTNYLQRSVYEEQIEDAAKALKRYPNSIYGRQDRIRYYTQDYHQTLKMMQQYATKEKENKCNMSKLNFIQIKNVVFNPPATIVFWADNSKTVVKAENENFDPEKGLAMAIAKKALGNKGNYYETFKKWLPKTESKEKPKTESKEKPKNGCHNCAFYSRSINERPCSNCNPYKHSEWKPMYTLSNAEDDDNVL